MNKINGVIVTFLGTALLLAAGLAQAQTAPSAASATPAAPAATSPAAAPASTTPPAPAAATAKVGQAQFTTAVNNREPADDISTLDNSHTQVFFFTTLLDAAGQTITHRWEYNGNTVAEVKFEPQANHWRVWSSKTLMPSQTGTWTVEVTDASGNVLTSKTLDYTQAPAGATLNAAPKVLPQATHKVTNPNSTTSAPAAATHSDNRH